MGDRTNSRRRESGTRPRNGAAVVELFPRPAEAASPAPSPDTSPDPDAGALRRVLEALSEVSAASLAYLGLATDLPDGLLTQCVEALAAEGLLTAEDRTDGHDGRRTVALTAKGRRMPGEAR